MVTPPIDKLLAARKNIRNNIALLEKKCSKDSFQTWQLSTIKKEHGLLDSWSNKLMEIQAELLTLATPDEDGAQATEKSESTITSTYEDIMLEISVLEDKLASHPKRLAAETPAPSPPVVSTVKLPVIKLPDFKGGNDNWLHFRDSFLTNIDARTDISAVEKMQYLISCLKDEAALLVANLPVSTLNYSVAWDIVMKRYDRKDVLITSQLRNLFNQPKMNLESASLLRKLIDTTTNCIATLKTLQQPTESWDCILIFMLTERIDTDSRRMYEMQRNTTPDPKFEDLITFLNKRADTLSIMETTKEKVTPDPRNSFNPKRMNDKKTGVHSHHTEFQITCAICKKNHKTYLCDQLEGLSIADKKKLLLSKGCCFNCLQRSHLHKNCTSKFSCLKCKERHNTILHEEKKEKDDPPSGNQEKNCTLTIPNHGQSEVLLATALVKVKNEDGNYIVVRALIDQGSEATFISENCAQQLKLPRTRVNVAVSGLQGSSVGTVKYSSKLVIQSCTTQFTTKVTAFILPGKLTKPLPTRTLSHFLWPHIRNLKLADPNFFISSPVDLLIGADLYAEILRCSGKCRVLDGPQDAPLAQKSVFGWLLTGRLPAVSHQTLTVSANLTFTVDETLQRFWELEQVPTITPRTEEEKEVEAHFSKTHERLPSGHHQVRLPFRKNSQLLGTSREAAVQRFIQIEKKMMKNSEYRLLYKECIQSYFILGHIQKLKKEELYTKPSKCYYLPHHAVLKPESLSTKLRIVFDGSAKTSTGVSLNEVLMVGPNVQNSLLTILLNFRRHVVAFTADVTKMYRMVKMHPQDCSYLRIVWRDEPSEPLDDYELLTVTFGTSSAPYQATKCLQYFTTEEKMEFSTATERVKSDFYVDDLLTGDSTSEDAIKIKDDIVNLLKRASFELTKFSSNDSKFMNTIPLQCRSSQEPLSLDSQDSVKLLGLQWHPASDEFTFKVELPVRQAGATKRTLLSDTSRLFDPTGVASPTTVIAKMLLQSLWKLSLNWDDPLPLSLQEQWKAYQDQLPQLESIRISRCVFPKGSSTFQLHGFADASSVAYAAAVYVRSKNYDGSVNVYLLTAKTKVAPIKMTSIPRLELCAALTLSQLISYVVKSVRVDFEEIHAWTDSTIALDWIAGSQTKQEIFVANRVAKIIEALPSKCWHHVRSEENPADCASRGIPPTELVNHPLWWHGPLWLQQDPFPINEPRVYIPHVPVEEREVQMFYTSTDPSPILKCNQLSVLLNSTAYWFRFLHNFQNPDSRIPKENVITSSERKKALHHWIKHIQTEFFWTEMQALKNKKPLNLKSRILQLNPFLDEAGLLRVGGRLRKAPISYDKKFPILLPRKSELTKLIIMHEHIVLFHGGAQLLLASLQQRFWIVNGRDLIRQYVGRCLTCTRLQGTTAKQMMGDLPAVRITPCEPFLKCGVDYAGPFSLRVMRGRSKFIFKGYVALFVCFVTRAIHLELAGDLTTETFLGVLRRFVARRGKCSDIYSDCGSNFVGATKELREFLKFTSELERDPSVGKQLASVGVTWHFNPPGAPHMGGLWEAGVKSMKFHLKRVVGEAMLTYEEMNTVLTQIEACLNSRPIGPLSNDPNDLEPLTPGHFLIGRALTALPEPDLDHLPVNRLSRWQHTQRIVQHLWKRWSSEYVPRLQRRPKWMEPQVNLEVGNLVLLKDECLLPLRWKLARVTELHTGDDNNVRVVTIRIGKKYFKRHVNKLVLLPIVSHEIPKNN